MSFMLPVKYAHVQKMNVAEIRMYGMVCGGHTMRDLIQNEVIRDKVVVDSVGGNDERG